MNRRCLLALLVLVPVTARAQFQEAITPQPTLPTEKLVIVSRDGTSHDFLVEMALSQDQQMTGEMFRTEIPANTGMLFDWGVPRESQMWMKDTLVPLDMVFINPDGSIRAIAENTVPQSLAVIDSHGSVRATLELQGGLTAKLNIRVGDTVKQRIFGNAP
jgi:uncharacterized membrane protein (UPF0127 family)